MCARAARSARASTWHARAARWFFAASALGCARDRDVARGDPAATPSRSSSASTSSPAPASAARAYTPLPPRPSFSTWEPPSYAAPVVASPFRFTAPSGEIDGTLTLPRAAPGAATSGRARPPIVVLVPGSGPLDRDETMGAAKVFADLALGLAARGIASLRYDKPMFAHPAEWAARFARTATMDIEVTDDAVAAIAAVRDLSEIDASRVILVGHSQGGLATPRIAARAGPLAGLVLLATPSRPFEAVVLGQFEYLATLTGPFAERARDDLPRLRAQVGRVRAATLTPTTAKTELPLGIPASFWLDLRGYDPVARVAALGLPTLIVQGEADFVVTMEDFEGFRRGLAGQRQVQLASVPGLAHTLVDCGCAKATPEDLARPGHVAVAVVDAIARFVGGAAPITRR